jgi:hypothetical protein
MARGRTLVRDLLPVLQADLDDRLDTHAAGRLAKMCQRYAAYIERERDRLEGSG